MIFASLFAAAALVATPQHVFVLAGQSNMSGRGQPLTEASQPDPRLTIWRGAWVEAGDPLSAEGGIGPGMTFGLSLVPWLGSVGLVMCANGGSTIADWQPGAEVYDHCLAQLHAANHTIDGMLFLQGESEAQDGSGSAAAAWAAGFMTMLAGWRNEIAGRWPLLLGEIGSLDPGRFPAQQQVRDAQASVAGDPRVRLVSTVDLADDGVHFTVAADRELGVRYAAAFLSTYRFPRHLGL